MTADDCIRTVWKFGAIYSYDHLQLCSFDLVSSRWEHDRTVKEGIFVVVDYYLKSDKSAYAVMLTENGDLRGCWFMPDHVQWVRIE